MAYIFCNKCGKVIETNQKYCSNCGTNQESNNINTSNIQQNINNTIKRKNKKGKITGIVPGIILIIIVALIVKGALSYETPEEENYKIVKDYITSYEDFTEVIKKCGFSDYKLERAESMDNYDAENSKCFTLQEDKILGYLCIKDGSIYSIQYNNEYLYKDKQILHTLLDYIITSNERSQIITYCENNIKTILKSPSTAKFPWDYNEWSMKKEKGVITVQSYVDAQNSFGGTIRSKFQFIIENGNTKSLIFDGKEYIK